MDRWKYLPRRTLALLILLLLCNAVKNFESFEKPQKSDKEDFITNKVDSKKEIFRYERKIEARGYIRIERNQFTKHARYKEGDLKEMISLSTRFHPSAIRFQKTSDTHEKTGKSRVQNYSFKQREIRIRDISIPSLIRFRATGEDRERGEQLCAFQEIKTLNDHNITMKFKNCVAIGNRLDHGFEGQVHNWRGKINYFKLSSRRRRQENHAVTDRNMNRLTRKSLTPKEKMTSAILREESSLLCAPQTLHGREENKIFRNRSHLQKLQKRAIIKGRENGRSSFRSMLRTRSLPKIKEIANQAAASLLMTDPKVKVPLKTRPEFRFNLSRERRNIFIKTNRETADYLTSSMNVLSGENSRSYKLPMLTQEIPSGRNLESDLSLPQRRMLKNSKNHTERKQVSRQNEQYFDLRPRVTRFSRIVTQLESSVTIDPSKERLITKMRWDREEWRLGRQRNTVLETNQKRIQREPIFMKSRERLLDSRSISSRATRRDRDITTRWKRQGSVLDLTHEHQHFIRRITGRNEVNGMRFGSSIQSGYRTRYLGERERVPEAVTISGSKLTRTRVPMTQFQVERMNVFISPRKPNNASERSDNQRRFYQLRTVEGIFARKMGRYNSLSNWEQRANDMRKRSETKDFFSELARNQKRFTKSVTRQYILSEQKSEHFFSRRDRYNKEGSQLRGILDSQLQRRNIRNTYWQKERFTRRLTLEASTVSKVTESWKSVDQLNRKQKILHGSIFHNSHATLSVLRKSNFLLKNFERFNFLQPKLGIKMSHSSTVNHFVSSRMLQVLSSERQEREDISIISSEKSRNYQKFSSVSTRVHEKSLPRCKNTIGVQRSLREISYSRCLSQQDPFGALVEKRESVKPTQSKNRGFKLNDELFTSQRAISKKRNIRFTRLGRDRYSREEKINIFRYQSRQLYSNRNFLSVLQRRQTNTIIKQEDNYVRKSENLPQVLRQLKKNILDARGKENYAISQTDNKPITSSDISSPISSTSVIEVQRVKIRKIFAAGQFSRSAVNVWKMGFQKNAFQTRVQKFLVKTNRYLEPFFSGSSRFSPTNLKEKSLRQIQYAVNEGIREKSLNGLTLFRRLIASYEKLRGLSLNVLVSRRTTERYTPMRKRYNVNTVQRNDRRREFSTAGQNRAERSLTRFTYSSSALRYSVPRQSVHNRVLGDEEIKYSHNFPLSKDENVLTRRTTFTNRKSKVNSENSQNDSRRNLICGLKWENIYSVSTLGSPESQKHLVAGSKRIIKYNKIGSVDRLVSGRRFEPTESIDKEMRFTRKQLLRPTNRNHWGKTFDTPKILHSVSTERMANGLNQRRSKVIGISSFDRIVQTGSFESHRKSENKNASKNLKLKNLRELEVDFLIKIEPDITDKLRSTQALDRKLLPLQPNSDGLGKLKTALTYTRVYQKSRISLKKENKEVSVCSLIDSGNSSMTTKRNTFSFILEIILGTLLLTSISTDESKMRSSPFRSPVSLVISRMKAIGIMI